MHKPLSKEDMNMTTYGYARVGRNGQDLGSQEAEPLAAVCAKVFKEKVDLKTQHEQPIIAGGGYESIRRGQRAKPSRGAPIP
jgi:hypothetical protein